MNSYAYWHTPKTHCACVNLSEPCTSSLLAGFSRATPPQSYGGVARGDLIEMSMTERRLDALRNDANLARFVTQGRRTGRQLGTGSYGSVEEVLTDLNSNSTLRHIYTECALQYCIMHV